MTQDLVNENEVDHARDYFYKKIDKGEEAKLTDFSAKFGIGGYIESGDPFASTFSPARFFVGSYAINIYTMDDGNLHFVLTNSTNTTSVMHEFGFGSMNVPNFPSWSRPYPGGDFGQVYTWIEPPKPRYP